MDTLVDNMDKPDFEAEITQKLAIRLNNDLAVLGANGVSDTRETFINLNQGWPAVAKNSSKTSKVNTHGDTSIAESLSKLITTHNGKFRSQAKTKFIMSQAANDAYGKELADKDVTANIMLNGNANKFRGYEIIVNPYMPDNEFLFCDPKHLVFAISKRIHRSRAFNNIRRTMDWVFSMHIDYAILMDAAIAVAWDQGA